MEIIHPEGWPRPSGYANGVKASGELVFVAGQVAWDDSGHIVGEDVASQSEQVLKNVVAVLHEAGAKPEHLTKMTWYVTDIVDYKKHTKEVGAAYRRVLGQHYPAMALVQVVALVEDGAKVEVEAMAVIPER